MEVEIPEPQGTNDMLTGQDVASGEPIAPLTRLKIIDADRWEDVTLELVYYWKTQYPKVVRCGGGGDMGRDVIAYTDQTSGKWENFQCKHYSAKLNEIGKLFYYVQKGEFSIPEKYHFITPLGVSTDLLNHLMDSDKLKSAVITRWNKDIKNKITSRHEGGIELTDDLRDFIDTVNFQIFDHIPPIEIIELHSNTPYHAALFGAQAKKRPKPPAPPKVLAKHEIVYTSELLRAFGDAEGHKVDMNFIQTKFDYKEEYEGSRKNFYAAEDLEKFSRDWLPNNSYADLLEECYEAVSSTVRKKFDNGYERYLSTTEHASLADYTSHPLSRYIKMQDKKGMCHQLVNESRITWVKGKSQ